jgi:hypothetical protein
MAKFSGAKYNIRNNPPHSVEDFLVINIFRIAFFQRYLVMQFCLTKSRAFLQG